jgi:hypothetical protein
MQPVSRSNTTQLITLKRRADGGRRRSRSLASTLVRACRPPSPRCLRVEVHPSVSFTSPSEHCAFRPAPGPDSNRSCDRPEPRQERLPWGSAPSSRRQPAASTHARGSHPALRSVLGVSHAHDGFRHHRPCGFVSPRCHVQGSPFRGFSPARSANRFPGPPCPRAVVRRDRTRRLPSVRGALGFRALLSERMRWSSTTVRPPGLRSPPGLAPPPGLPPAHRAPNPGLFGRSRNIRLRPSPR